MATLVDNMKQNIQHATLYDLKTHGLIDGSTNLNIEVIREISLQDGEYYHDFLTDPELSFLKDTDIKYIGQLTVSQTMTYMFVVFDVISEAENQLN